VSALGNHCAVGDASWENPKILSALYIVAAGGAPSLRRVEPLSIPLKIGVDPNRSEHIEAGRAGWNAGRRTVRGTMALGGLSSLELRRARANQGGSYERKSSRCSALAWVKVYAKLWTTRVD
jgi:hypothetical protein